MYKQSTILWPLNIVILAKITCVKEEKNPKGMQRLSGEQSF